MSTDADFKELNARLADASPREILACAFDTWPNCALSFSGAEDVLLLHLASKLRPDVRVFTLDTGRLHAQTYEFIERVRKTYGLRVDMLYPDAERLRRLVSEKGLFSFYRDGHEECCEIRKIEPMRRHLEGFDAWISGIRRDQSPTRLEIDVFEIDARFSNMGVPLIKINPLANQTSGEVWNQIRMLEIPYNPLHDQGFASIGCEPCTRPTGPGQHEREGRWWWEEATLKECGLHKK
ncbi:MAG: phosphoadenylyl-sulfate reductase [Gammaproteobacteria bacterium]|nr:phosphoadenylyl-sulfate reductase [Gammaproteobacteria bacterium]MDE0479894.1 phosphoadenylyl-sulfate reductase [Gammaproteobacteria bacterium]MDE0509183.1 phosphoadenylyl-sulfate reductase [Gammaproteobacteria bacterium]MYC59634.1 phosphoadenylyl-sulfate reductase [Gammaproteobacteria bacterium]